MKGTLVRYEISLFEIDIENLSTKSNRRFNTRYPLTGDGDILKPLIVKFVQDALDTELSDHLSEERAAGESNRHNGKVSKKIHTESGGIPIEYSRDRNSSFDPVTVKKANAN